jgi:hypothetical protein
MNELIATVLEQAWQGGFKTKSNFARSLANEVAICASLGLISTKIQGTKFGTTWYITKTGMEYYNECYKS